MKTNRFLCLIMTTVVLATLLMMQGCTNKSLLPFTDYVNPMVGTDATGHTFPGACAPFGMVQLSPDTRLDTWEGCSGYHYMDNTIIGFSHTHLSGTGCIDYGDIMLMPVVSYPLDTLNRDFYKSEFSHDNEIASAGYYEVLLDRWNVRVALTAGRRAAMHSYTFNTVAEDGTVGVILDLEHRDYMIEGEFEFDGKRSFTGFRRSSSWSQDHMVHFYLEFDTPVKECRYLGKSGAYIIFDAKKGDRVVAKVGISSVSSENAKENLESEVPADNFDFAALHDKSLEMWNEYLGKIDVRGDGCEDVNNLRIFYTAMYHTAIAPNLYSDVNGLYRGMDKKIHKAEGYDRYTVFSLWDTFRTLHPMLNIIERRRSADFMDSFLSIYREGGKLPIWELSGWETNCMIGYNSTPVIADCITKGIDKFATGDVADFLDAMVVSSNKDEFGIRYYRDRYVVPAEKEHESVSKTLEYAFDDWCISVVADTLYRRTGEEKYAQIRDKYLEYSKSYVNIFDPSTGFMRPLLSNSWVKPFDPREVNNHFTEANSWQYSFFTPHDISGHIALLGGEESYCAKIDSLFCAVPKTSGRVQVDITGLIGQYAHGNEPSHHMAYLYSYAGKPWKGYERVREILTELYTDTPDGLCGNDDCGQMSAWYVMSAIGLYPVTPGSDCFVFAAPLFSQVRINLEDGSVFVIKSDNKKNKYIKGATLNGREYEKGYIRFSDIISGGELSFRTSGKPDYDFAVAQQNRPSSSVDIPFMRNPWFEYESDIFEDSITFSISGIPQGGKAYYRVVPLKPGETLERMDERRVNALQKGEFKPFDGDVRVDRTSILFAYVTDSQGNRSRVVTSAVYRLKDDMDITTECRYNPQYNARGAKGLIDGLRGSENWKTGGWQGFQATDFTAVVDLRSVKEIRSIGSGYCQDARSWIWMPVYVEYSISEDGVNFTPVGRVDRTTDPKDYEIQVRDFVLDLGKNARKARYVKVFAKNFGKIPEWHLGAGGQAFIFIDEIWVD
ncbi:MAG: GH92 family glycosyl hydrolase [Candidatus Coprenecus sp.]